MSLEDEHPIWELYDLLRTAKLSAKYYSYQFDAMVKYHKACKIFLAIMAPGSAFTGIAFWEETGCGRITFSILTVLTGLVSIILPLIHFEEKIKKLSKLVSGYNLLYGTLNSLRSEIKHSQEYSQKYQQKFFSTLKQHNDLIELEGAEALKVTDKKLRAKCEDEVYKEIPKTSLYFPKIKGDQLDATEETVEQ